VVDAEVEHAGFRGVSKRVMPAPLPPMFAFTSTGKRSSAAAAGAWEAWLITRDAGCGSPSFSSMSICAALEISKE
jgi:hypothetical protein